MYPSPKYKLGFNTYNGTNGEFHEMAFWVPRYVSSVFPGIKDSMAFLKASSNKHVELIEGVQGQPGATYVLKSQQQQANDVEHVGRSGRDRRERRRHRTSLSSNMQEIWTVKEVIENQKFVFSVDKTMAGAPSPDLDNSAEYCAYFFKPNANGSTLVSMITNAKIIQVTTTGSDGGCCGRLLLSIFMKMLNPMIQHAIQMSMECQQNYFTQYGTNLPNTVASPSVIAQGVASVAVSQPSVVAQGVAPSVVAPATATQPSVVAQGVAPSAVAPASATQPSVVAQGLAPQAVVPQAVVAKAVMVSQVAPIAAVMQK